MENWKTQKKLYFVQIRHFAQRFSWSEKQRKLGYGHLNTCMIEMAAYQVGSYQFILSPGWHTSLLQGYPPSAWFAGTHSNTWLEGGTIKVKSLNQWKAFSIFWTLTGFWTAELVCLSANNITGKLNQFCLKPHQITCCPSSVSFKSARFPILKIACKLLISIFKTKSEQSIENCDLMNVFLTWVLTLQIEQCQQTESSCICKECLLLVYSPGIIEKNKTMTKGFNGDLDIIEVAVSNNLNQGLVLQNMIKLIQE